MDLRGVGLAELRTRYARRGARAGATVIRALRDDERAGARALAELLEARRRRAVAERSRLRRLFARERALRAEGCTAVCGVDEVGMGPLAGPVVAAAVILPPGFAPRGLRDSKQLSAAARERLDAEIREAGRFGIGRVEPAEIDRINIYQAGLLAMRRAVDALPLAPAHALVDARRIPGVPCPQTPVVGGDASVGSIAAASVVAKVCRDAWMRELDTRWPGYGLADNAGYGTPEHLAALAELGPSPEHRRSFAPVRAVLGERSPGPLFEGFACRTS